MKSLALTIALLLSPVYAGAFGQDAPRWSIDAEADAVALADRAAERLARLRSGWETEDVRRAVFGVLSESEIERLRERIGAVLELVASARPALAAAIDGAERRGEFDDAERREQLDRAIAIESAVLPLAAARAIVIRGVLDGDDRAVASGAEAASGVRTVGSWSRSERAAVLGVAAEVLGDAQLARESAGAVAAELRSDDRLRALSDEPGSTAWGQRIVASLIDAGAERLASGWAAALARLGMTVDDAEIVMDARLRFARDEAEQLAQSGDGRGAIELRNEAAQPVAELIDRPFAERSPAWNEPQITARIAAMVGGGDAARRAGPRGHGDAIVIAWAVEAKRRGEDDRAFAALEELIERDHNSDDSGDAAGASFEGPLRELGWALYVRLVLDRALAVLGPADARAVRSAIAFARANPSSLDTGPILLDAAAEAWSGEPRARDEELQRLRLDASEAVIELGPGLPNVERGDVDYWRARLAASLAAEAARDAQTLFPNAERALELAAGTLPASEARGRALRAIASVLAFELAKEERALLDRGRVGLGVRGERVESLVRTVVARARDAGRDGEPRDTMPGELQAISDWLGGWLDVRAGAPRAGLVRLRRAVSDGGLAAQGLGGGERLLAMHAAVRAALLAGAYDDARVLHRDLAGNGQPGAREALAALLLVGMPAWSATPPVNEALPRLGDGAEAGEDRAALVFVLERIADDPLAPIAMVARGLTRLVDAGAAADALPLIIRARERAETGTAAELWLRLLEADARLALGDDARAFGVYREVAGGASPEDRAERWYWHASARMLQVLQRQNASGQRTEPIRREVKRLMLQPTWGEHTDCCDVIEGVGTSVGVQ